MKVQHWNRCSVCDEVFVALVAWDDKTPPCPSCQGEAVRFYRGTVSMIDDGLPGGGRWMENLGDRRVWVTKKSQLRREMTSRGLEPAERKTYNRDDRSPWATQTRLRPGARDPSLQRA